MLLYFTPLSMAAFRSRAPPPRLQLGSPLGPAPLSPLGGAAGTSPSTLLFQDQKAANTRGAEKERKLLEPNTQEMALPKKRSGRGRGAAGAGGGGFGKGSKGKAKRPVGKAHALRADATQADGVVLVPDVLSKESAQRLHACVRDELGRAYAAVEQDPSCSVARFNVPAETHDPQRGYLLLPLRDEQSVAACRRSSPGRSTLPDLHGHAPVTP